MGMLVPAGKDVGTNTSSTTATNSRTAGTVTAEATGVHARGQTGGEGGSLGGAGSRVAVLEVEDKARVLYRFKEDALLLGKHAVATPFSATYARHQEEDKTSAAGLGGRSQHALAFHRLQRTVKRVLMVMLTTAVPEVADEESVKQQAEEVLLRRHDVLAHAFLDALIGSGE